MKTYRVLVKGITKIISFDILADKVNAFPEGGFIKLSGEKGEAYFKADEIAGVLEVETLARESVKSSV